MFHVFFISSNSLDCRTTSVQKCRTRSGFKQCDVILTKEQSVLTQVMSSFEEENMQTQKNILGYRIHLYFHGYKLAIEIDENGHNNRNMDYEIKRHEGIEQVLSFNFNRIGAVCGKKKSAFLKNKELHNFNNI